MSYNDIVDFMSRDTSLYDGEYWSFCKIIGHESTPHNHPAYKGSRYNVRILWENGEITDESLKIFAKDAPVECALYAKRHDLLDLPSWKCFRRLAKREGLIQRLCQQAKLRSFRTSPKYKYGYEVPKTYEHAVRLDAAAGNNKWKDANKLEMEQLRDYDVFIDKGSYHESKIPRGYKKISVHIIFDVKHDGRHKARCGADGHLTDTPVDSIYAGVVSLRGFQMCLFLAELNDMEAYATDIENAYLEAYTSEKLVIRAGKAFGDQEGHLLIISKALYGLCSSGLRFNELLGKCLTKLGFKRSMCEADIWYQDAGDCYEYIATYVDDLFKVLKAP